MEYQKELPVMKTVNHKLLETDQKRFQFAVRKLQNEGLITGATFTGPNTITVSVMLTVYGLQYVEEVLELKSTMSAGDKVKDVSKKVTTWGYNELKDFSAKVLGEVVSKSIS
ncbi:YjcQ family protein [Bacillus paranthracis]